MTPEKYLTELKAEGKIEGYAIQEFPKRYIIQIKGKDGRTFAGSGDEKADLERIKGMGL